MAHVFPCKDSQVPHHLAHTQVLSLIVPATLGHSATPFSGLFFHFAVHHRPFPYSFCWNVHSSLKQLHGSVPSLKGPTRISSLPIDSSNTPPSARTMKCTVFATHPPLACQLHQSQDWHLMCSALSWQDVQQCLAQRESSTAFEVDAMKRASSRHEHFPFHWLISQIKMQHTQQKSYYLF